MHFLQFFAQGGKSNWLEQRHLDCRRAAKFAGSYVHGHDVFHGVGEDAHCGRLTAFLKALGARVNACSVLVSLLRCKLAN